MRLVGDTAQQLAGVGLDDCGLIDLYSCFPVAVQVARRELGLDPGRDVTITGGMTFAAGPLNCYCILALTRAVELLRDDPTQIAYLTGNGGEFTRHSALVLGASPSKGGFDAASPQADVHALPDRPSPVAPARDATLETATVLFDREAVPERAIVAALDADGCRHLAGTDDPDTLTELLAADCCGRPVRLDDGIARLG
jgi:acetyl-CoA C-acetyltransferase